MGKRFRLGLVALTALISVLVAANSVSATYAESDPFCIDIVYGDKEVDVGDVCVWSDDDNLYVKIKSDNDVSETHLNVSKSPLTWYPPGQWPYKHENLAAGTKIDTYCISLVDLAVSCDDRTKIYLMAHASIPPESAYGKEFQGSFSLDITRSCGGASDEPQQSDDRVPPLPEVPTFVSIAIGLVSIAFLVRRKY